MQERILNIMQKQTALLENTVELCSHPAPQPSHPAACTEHRILGVPLSSPKFYPLRKGEQFPPTYFCELISTAICVLRSLGMFLHRSIGLTFPLHYVSSIEVLSCTIQLKKIAEVHFPFPCIMLIINKIFTQTFVSSYRTFIFYNHSLTFLKHTTSLTQCPRPLGAPGRGVLCCSKQGNSLPLCFPAISEDLPLAFTDVQQNPASTYDKRQILLSGFHPC